jgi:hypothetical protein
MTAERVPYHVGQEPAPEQESAHEHLFRVVFGKAIAIRFCERCGKTWLLQEVRDLIHNRSVYEWDEVQEPGTRQENIPAEPDSQPRLKRYINE